jgi:hypothetical protein
MSASMSKTFMSPDFLTKFLEEYRELPVLWQVRSADYSNREKRDEAWELLVQFTREKIPDADLCFVKKKVYSIRASFRKELRRARNSSIITAAATCFDELVLDTEMYEESSESAHAYVVKYIRARLPSQARRSRLVRVRASLLVRDNALTRLGKLSLCRTYGNKGQIYEHPANKTKTLFRPLLNVADSGLLFSF